MSSANEIPRALPTSTTLRLKAGAVRRRIYELFKNPKYSRPSWNGLDERLEKYLNFDNGFFIEVGANDGFMQSNTYYYEKIRGWRGVLIEPIPELYEVCKARRGRSQVFNCALVSKEYTEPVVQMHFAHLMSVTEGAMKSEEARKEHIARGVETQTLRSTYSVDVPARTLESVLDEARPEKIDFFSLDVEGFEAEVLKGMNFERYAPTYILVEANFQDEVDMLLLPYYEVADKLSHHDVLYRRRGA